MLKVATIAAIYYTTVTLWLPIFAVCIIGWITGLIFSETRWLDCHAKQSHALIGRSSWVWMIEESNVENLHLFVVRSAIEFPIFTCKHVKWLFLYSQDDEFRVKSPNDTALSSWLHWIELLIFKLIQICKSDITKEEKNEKSCTCRHY